MGCYSLTFIIAPLAGELRIIGPSAAKLFVIFSTEDADLVLILSPFTWISAKRCIADRTGGLIA